MNRRPLDPIFSPRSVAVVGASRSRDSLGWAILHNLVTSEFAGAIYPVNPHARAIHSLRAYPSLAAIPDPVDLVMVVVPKAHVESVIDEGLAAGVGGFVVITAGFGEVSEAGREVERRLRDRVRAAGVRMIGPNCMGVINADPEVRLNATFSPTPARWGSLGFVSQSGALGVAILNVAEDLGVGLSQFVSMGNKADVSGNDLVEHWADDPATKVIAMYLESFGNPRRFTEIAKRVTRKKPILVVKSGRTAEGARAASSHTGALAGADVTISALLDQCGVLRAATIDEMFDTARALDRCPLPAGRRVAIVTNAGGPGIMATDACVDGCFERRQVDVVKLGVGDVSRVVIAPTYSRAVACEVFHAGEQPAGACRILALESTYLRGGDSCAEERIFTCTLDDAAPTWIARDVEHRCERPADAGSARLARRDRLHALDEVHVPRRSQR